MLLIDAHLDLSMNALQGNRDLLASAYTIRSREQKVAGPGRGQGTVAFPEMRRGRVALSFATLIARSTGRPAPHIDFDSPAQAYGVAAGQLAYYRALEEMEVVRVITNVDQLDSHWSDWIEWEADEAREGEEPPLGFIISMEGADPILYPEQVEAWYAAGLRAIGPAHYGPCRYAGGTGTEIGLTDLGRPLLEEMDRLGMLLDLTHLSDQAFWEALEVFDGSVLASHNNCRALVPHQRQFSDDQLRAIFERDGVIGAAFDIWMVTPNWRAGQQSSAGVYIGDVVNHIDHICQLAGNAQHVALGTDLDGGFGREQSPCDLDTIADLQQVPEILAERGYKESDIRAICYGNWLRLLHDVL